MSEPIQLLPLLVAQQVEGLERPAAKFVARSHGSDEGHHPNTESADQQGLK